MPSISEARETPEIELVDRGQSAGVAGECDPPLALGREGKPRRHRSPRQQEESARNRAVILSAAVRVFAERGYAQTTLESIAKLVGLTRQGVLHHFSSKESLFSEVIADQERWAREQLHAEPPTGDLSDLQALMPMLGRTASSRSRLQLVQVLQGEAMSGNPAAHDFAAQRLVRVRMAITAQLAHAQQAGRLRPDTDLEALATLVAAAVNGLQAQWLLDDEVDTGAAFDQLLSLLERPVDGRP